MKNNETMQKVKQPTKEELIIKVAALQVKIDSLHLTDIAKREEFARAFKWYKPQQAYSYSSTDLPEPLLPTWEQIWVHLGSLLNDRSLVDLTEKQSKLELDFKGFQNEWFRSLEQKKSTSRLKGIRPLVD